MKPSSELQRAAEQADRNERRIINWRNKQKRLFVELMDSKNLTVEEKQALKRWLT